MNFKKNLTIILPMMLIAVVGLGAFMMLPSNSLTMDVNPSIEIETNRLERVVSINPLNLDAQDLLKNFSPRDKTLEGVVNDLVDLMILTGHIKGGDDNIVMISVKDDDVDNELLQKVNRAISAFLENKQIEATILNQTIENRVNSSNKSGREVIAERISTLGVSLSAEELSDMTIKQLIKYSKDNNIDTQTLFLVVTGNIEKSINTNPYISKEQAKKIALDLVNGEIVKIELDDLRDDDDTPEYEIEIIKDGVKYEIEIDAYTGRVKEFERDDDNSIKDTNVNGRNIISPEEARRIALGRVNGEIIKFELDDDDDDDDDIEYEIEIRKDGIKYELEIDAFTGVITEFEIDDDDDSIRNTNVSGRNIISPEEARRIALERVNGEIIKFELDDDDDDDDDIEYEIEIRKDGVKYEIEIDAYTGRITEFERDDDDDDSYDSTNIIRKRITADEARRIALSLVNGTITEFEEDDDEYEIEIIKDGKEYEIEIDIYTGKVLKFEEDD